MMKFDTSEPMTGQRAFWSLLLITLVAPLLVAVVIFMSAVIAGAVGRGPASLLALDRGGQFAWAAEHAIGAYVWSAIPAAAAGAIFAGLVLARQSTHWLISATIAAVTATVFAALSGGMIAQHIAPIAFIAALVGIAMSALIRRIGIVA